MNMFRQPPRKKRQTMDGILSAPSRPQLTGRPLSRSSLGGDSFRTTPRKIGDFKQSAGYHVANSTVATPHHGKHLRDKPGPAEEASLLNMTLPEGKFGVKDKEKGASKNAFLARLHIKDWHTFRKYSLRGGLIVLVLLLIIGGFLFTKGYLKLHKVFKGGGSSVALNKDVAPALLKGEGDGRINILLLGRGGEGHDGADLTDTIVVASIDPVNNKASLVSLPRDFWVTTASGSSKVNAVFAFAKERQLLNTKDNKKAEVAAVEDVKTEIKDIFGISIHYYGMVDFSAFQKAVDTVGGVDINVTPETAVTETLFDMTTRKNFYLNVTPGAQHFDGQKALFYARSRHTSPRGDFDRSERQRLLLQALSQKVTSASTFTNPVKVSQLMDTFGDHVATDISLNDGMRLLTIGKGIGGSFESIDLANPSAPVVKTGMVGNQSVVMPVAGTSDYSQIQALIRSKLKDGYLVKENPTVTVLNGTSTPGLATKKAEELKSYGYNVLTVADAPTQTYEKTVVVDLTNGKKPYTKNYLEKRFGVKTVTALPDQAIQPGTADFAIILGP